MTDSTIINILYFLVQLKFSVHQRVAENEGFKNQVSYKTDRYFIY